MSISSTRREPRAAPTVSQEGKEALAPITLSERSITCLALLRIFVGFLWFQQLFWKLPPTFAGLYPYVVRESHSAILPGWGFVLQHTFLVGCTSSSAAAGCTLFIPLAACVWTAELLVSISLMFGLFTRFGAILGCILSIQMYIGLSTTDWYWTYGMLVLLCLFLTAVPAGRRLGIDQWLSPRLHASANKGGFARALNWLA
jgi:uncharacterized membrane protein YphA (DoxX/SURF4 family)